MTKLDLEHYGDLQIGRHNRQLRAIKLAEWKRQQPGYRRNVIAGYITCGLLTAAVAVIWYFALKAHHII